MKNIKYGLLIFAMVLVGNTVSAGTNDVGTLLQRGLFEEEANHNLDAAIQAYQSVVAQTDKERRFAATAIFRLGECYRKQGKTNEATTQYERIVREFADQPELVKLSKGYVGNAASSSPPANQVLSAEASAPTTSEEAEEIKRIQTMIRNSPDLINAAGTDGEVPLQKAARAGQLTVARFLLENKADINGKGTTGFTPLHLAAFAGHKAMVELLLANGGDVKSRDQQSRTPLHVAAEKGFTAVTELLLSRGAEVNALSNKKETPLNLVASKGNTIIAELLINNKADVNSKGEQGETPLMEAAQAGKVEMAKVLIAHGADVNARLDHKDGGIQSEWAALHYAIKKNQNDMLKLLLESGAKTDLKVTENYIETSPYRSVVCTDFTPLHLATSLKQKETAELLLKYKANVNASDSEGRTPLVLAQQKNSKELFELLVNHQADVSVLDKNQNTLLQLAVANGQKEIAALLLNKKVDVDARYKNGNTPLYLAVTQSDKDMVELLLNHGADVNAVGEHSVTPIFRSLAPSGLKITELLIQRGADVNATDKNGATPLDGVHDSYENSKWVEQVRRLLRAHGGVSGMENTTVRIIRPGLTAPEVLLTKDKASLNRFTLFELLTVVFGSNERRWVFPDFNNVTIETKDSASGKKQKLKIALAGALESGDCSKNIWLEWGDVLEIPELDHKLNETWGGLSSNARRTLENCLAARVDIVVKGQTNSVILKPDLKNAAASFEAKLKEITTRASNGAAETNALPVISNFRLNQVVHMAGVILASSDLSRVKVKRMNPSTNKPDEMVFNLESASGGLSNLQYANQLSIPSRTLRQPAAPGFLSANVLTVNEQYNAQDDLWLRDGDVIEIPEKQ
ncbi:MAG: Ankyrin repeat-like protein [Pedosphaera sp.]|nr:Ankyrin repeat-like protein [Pedosphaera sp.]